MINIIADLRAARLEVRKSVDIVKVVQDDLGAPQKQTGSDSFWFCPFHSESKGASFGVHSGLQIYKCFGCQTGGDVVAWTQNYFGLSTAEAIERLAKNYSVDISSYYRPPTPEELERMRYQDICEEAAKFCSSALLSNKEILGWYKSDTGFDLDQIVTYDVGYSVSPDNLIQHLFSKIKGITQDDIDRLEFTNRLMWTNSLVYPVRDQTGKIARFYNKPLTPPPDFAGKYVGTSQKHPLFTNKLLYGFHAIRKDLRKMGYKIRIVEGQKAAIASGGVAVMGSQIHEAQVEILRDHGILDALVGFDGDAAGRAASLRLLDYMDIFAGINVRIARMPEGKQPDDIVRESGKETLNLLFNTAVIPVQFFVDLHRNSDGNIIVEDKFSLVNRLRDHLVKIPDIQLDLTAKYLADVLEIDPLSVKTFVVDVKLTGTNLLNRDAEQAVLQHVIIHPKAWSTLKQNITEAKAFTISGYQHVYNAIDSAHKKARENNTTDGITVQVIRDELGLMFPQFKELPKVVDSLITMQPKYEFNDALTRVVDLHRRRSGIEQSRVLQAMLGDLARPTNDILSKYRRQMVSSIEVRRDDTSHPVALADAVSRELEERMMRKSAIVGYDFSELRDVDGQKINCLTGTTLAFSGLQSGHQVVISAYSGVGKSLLALQMATSISICKDIPDQVPTLWIPLEMNAMETSFRQISMLTGIDNTRLQAGLLNTEEHKKVKAALDMIARSQFYIKKPKTGTIDEVFAIIDEYVFKYGVKAAFLDYIQLVASGNEDKGASREQVIGRASKVMKNQVAEAMGVVSVCIAQQNRQNYVAGDTGKIENMGGSYQIAQDADDVMLLAEKTPEQMAENKDRGNRTGFIDKRRGGTSDIHIDLDLDTSKLVSLRWKECLTPEQLMGLSKGLAIKGMEIPQA